MRRSPQELAHLYATTLVSAWRETCKPDIDGQDLSLLRELVEDNLVKYAWLIQDAGKKVPCPFKDTNG